MNYLFLLFFLHFFSIIYGKYLKIIKPVADIFAKLPEKIILNEFFSEIVSFKNNNHKIERSFSALYGEEFEIIEEINFNGHVLYIIKHKKCFYEKDNKLMNYFYINEKDVEVIDSKSCNKKNIVLISTVFINNEDLLIRLPFLLPGTKLKLIDNYIEIENQKIFIPEDKFLFLDYIKELSFDEKRNCIIELLYKWKSELKENQRYPYTWGGSSIGGDPINLFNFKEIQYENDTGFYYTNNSKYIVGADCSGIILLICKIFKIPFYLRNTALQKKHLTIIKNYDDLKNGDLLWINGHIWIIDKDNNKLMEMGGYSSGFYGFTITDLPNRFVGIENFQELFKKYENKESIEITNPNKINKPINEFEFLSLESILNLCYFDKI